MCHSDCKPRTLVLNDTTRNLLFSQTANIALKWVLGEMKKGWRTYTVNTTNQNEGKYIRSYFATHTHVDSDLIRARCQPWVRFVRCKSHL